MWITRAFLILGAAVWTATEAQAQAAAVTGRVLVEGTEAPVSGAVVTQVGSVPGSSTLTAGDGSFRLTLTGRPPHTLEIRRLGLRTARVDLSGGERQITVHLSLDAIPLESVDVEAERERLDFTVGSLRVTERGTFSAGAGRCAGRCWQRPTCAYLQINGVVVRDPSLHLPHEVERHEPANTILLRPFSVWRRYNIEDLDERVAEDAWPCTANRLLRHRHRHVLEAQHRLADVRLSHRAVPSHELSLRSSPTLVSIGSDGRVALLTGDELHIVGSDGAVAHSISSSEPLTKLGWRGATAWAVTATGELLEVDSLGETWMSGSAGPGAAASRRRAPPARLSDGQWLSEREAADPPYPPRHPARAPGMDLLVSDSSSIGGRVIAALQPGPMPLLDLLPTTWQPFDDHHLYDVDPGGGSVTVVDRRLERAVFWSTVGVTRISTSGDTIYAVEHPAHLEEPTPAAISLARGELPDDAALRDLLPSEQARDLVIAGSVRVPQFLPPISAVVAGWDGSTWLRGPETGDDELVWFQLGATGELERTLELPRDLELAAASGESIWGIRPEPGGGAHLITFEIRPL